MSGFISFATVTIVLVPNGVGKYASTISNTTILTPSLVMNSCFSKTTIDENKRLLNEYVEETFPFVAKRYGWPIRFNHCFRRVVYDTLCQDRWDKHVVPPAIDNMTPIQIIDCLTICKSIMQSPNCLIELNNLSLSYRTKIDE